MKDEILSYLTREIKNKIGRDLTQDEKSKLYQVASAITNVLKEQLKEEAEEFIPLFTV